MKSKSKLLATAMVILAAGIGLFLVKRTSHPKDPQVTAVVSKLPRPTVISGPAASNATSRPAAQTTRSAPQDPADRNPHLVSVAPPSAIANALSLSSYFSPAEVSGLSPEQLAQLELTLRSAKQATYALLLERAWITVLPNGDYKVVLDAQGEALREMKEYIMDSIQAIIGPDYMESLRPSLGTKFDQKFAYFGQYGAVFDLSIENRSTAPTRITIKQSYTDVPLGPFRGYVSSTSILYADDFAREFFPVGSLKPRP